MFSVSQSESPLPYHILFQNTKDGNGSRLQRGLCQSVTSQWLRPSFFTVCSCASWDRFKPHRNPKLDKWLKTWMDGQRSDKQTAVRIKVEWVWSVEALWDCGKTWFCFLISTIDEFIWRVHCSTCTAVQRMLILPCAPASSLSDSACSNHRFYNKTWKKRKMCKR